ncbi:ABC transporter permease subunit [Nonomuraea sp. H19]|uniref:ABC transporter permease subunit n=1 Tax=Nonomuraea sp. H19 TaxID=3452206 RepID=UPI003F89857D
MSVTRAGSRLRPPAPGRSRGFGGRWAGLFGALFAGAGLLTVIALLPWISGTDVALTVLRARSGEQDPSLEALAAVREQLGLDAGPAAALGHWLGALVRGDAGTSWVSGEPVTPALGAALGVSLTLTSAALVVTLAVAAMVCARTLWLGAHRRLTRDGAAIGAAVVAALPKFLLAAVLSTVLGVHLGWFPPYGWEGPSSMVLPALALGVPSGAMIGGLLDQALPAAFREPWARAATASGMPPGWIMRAALRRAVPGVLPQLLPTVVSLAGGAVAVEKIYAIPGLGMLTLDAAIAQDLPVLQSGSLALILLGAGAGLLVRSARRAMLGPALREGALPSLPLPGLDTGRALPAVAVGCALLLATAVGLGLLRDPIQVDTAGRLLAPSYEHPLGTDALGRDLLARLGHGALRTTVLAFAVTAVSLLLGVLAGLARQVTAGLTDIVSTLPVILAGLLVTAVAGPSALGAALAVCLVGWSPYAAQTTALLEQERAATHMAASVALGASRGHLIRRHLLPALVPPLLRNALLRLPTVVLVLASLGFLGLGEQPPAPEWGRLLSENQSYAELAPWTVLGPAAALSLLAVLAVAATALLGRADRRA